MKPNELMWALMRDAGLNPNRLAKSIKKPGMQASIHRFLRGEAGLDIGTTLPIAAKLDVPAEVFHDEKRATEFARVRGIAHVPMPEKRVRKPRQMTLPLIDEQRYQLLSSDAKEVVEYILQGGRPTQQHLDAMRRWHRKIEADMRKLKRGEARTKEDDSKAPAEQRKERSA